MPTLFPLLAIGGATLIWQVASARSIMAGLHGNELSLGLVLGAWLVLMGLSTRLSASWPRLGSGHGLSLLLFIAPVGLAISLLLQGRLLPAFSAVGEVASPPRALGLILLCLAPACLPLGGAFGAISRALPLDRAPEAWGARIYLIESLGTALAGLVFHFDLAHRSLAFAGLVAGAMVWVAALGVGRWAFRRRRIPWMLAGVSLLALAYMIPGVPLPGAALLVPRVPGYQLLSQVNSSHAALSVMRRGDQVLISANGQLAFSNQEDERAEALVHTTLVAHPRPRRVLLIGGGLDGGIREALKHPVERLDFVELDPALIGLARRFGGPAVRRALEDPRVQLQIADGRQFIAGRRHAFDVIMVGLAGPDSALANRFYTEEFFAQARAALRPGGIIRLLVEGSEGYLSDAQAQRLATIAHALDRSMGSSVIFPGGITLILSGKEGAPDVRPSTLIQRLRDRRLPLSRFSETELLAMVLPFKVEQVRRRLAGVQPLPNTDLHPAAYFNESLLWIARASPRLSGVLVHLAQGAQGWSWAAAAASFVLVLLWGGLRGKRAAGLAIFIAGFSGLVLEIGLVLAVQEIRGVIYHELAALLSAFMLGLALGARVGGWLVRRFFRWSLSLTLLLTGLSSLLAWGAAYGATRAPGAGLLIVLPSLAALGLAVGACFAPAVSRMKQARVETAVGRAYFWDLMGGAVGALVGSSFLIPVLGLASVCWLCGAICLASGLTVWR